MLRRYAVVAALAFVGCESLRKPAPNQVTDVRQEKTPADLSPRKLGEGNVGRPFWAVSQTAQKGRPTEEFAEVREADKAGEGSSAPPELQADPLTLAAECLEKGDRAGAAVHLEAYVRLHPEQIMFRAQLAELLVRVGRDEAAKLHFERFAADAGRATGAPKDHLVHVHTRLMEIGQRGGDRFAELFHRGAGLLLLVAEEDGKPDRDADFCEEMLCKALKALAEARELKPGEVRVRVALAEAYDRAGNRRAADAERSATRNGVLPTGIAPTLPR
jgi:thioredoxin-like negative regulator of GroEL